MVVDMKQHHRPSVDEVKLEFFEMMRRGYAGGAEKTTIAELPGSKVISYENGFYSGRDCYFVGGGGTLSFGSTVIYYKGQPVWFMQYHGRYQKRAIPLLKRALMFNYADNHFNGGRGPKLFEGDGWYYENGFAGDFSRFEGCETLVIDGSSLNGGWHKYSGMLLYAGS